MKGYSGAGLGESIVWGMEIDDEVVEKETCVEEGEREIFGAVEERESAVCVRGKVNVFSLVVKHLCAVSEERACGYVSS